MDMECGHPVECEDEEGECRWCQEVDSMKRQIGMMRDCVDKMAFRVMAGATLTIQTPDPIGLIENYGGTVNIEAGAMVSGIA